MNKNEYLNSLESELNKYSTSDISKVIGQAKDIINHIDEEKLEEILGTPKLYALELIENNNIKRSENEDNKIVNFLLTKILPYVILIVIGVIIAELFPGHLYIVFFTIAMLVLIARMIIFQRGVMEICIVVSFAVVTLFIVPFDVTEDITKFVSVVFLILFGIMKIIVNTINFLEVDKKALKSSFIETEGIVDINAGFGVEHHKIKDCKELILNTRCTRLFLDLRELDNDLNITIDSLFSEINLKIKEDTYIIDNSSILLGGNVFDLDNNIKYKDGNTITINGKLVGGAINLEA